MKGRLVTWEHPLNGPTASVKWNDGEKEDLHCGTSVTLEDGSRYRLEFSWDRNAWYLVHSGIKDVNGLVIVKEH